MTIKNPILLSEIENFLSRSGMGESYFGKAATGNSEVVARLRSGGRVWPETEAKIRSFILLREKISRHKAVMSAKEDIQAQPPQKQRGGNLQAPGKAKAAS